MVEATSESRGHHRGKAPGEGPERHHHEVLTLRLLPKNWLDMRPWGQFLSSSVILEAPPPLTEDPGRGSVLFTRGNRTYALPSHNNNQAGQACVSPSLEHIYTQSSTHTLQCPEIRSWDPLRIAIAQDAPSKRDTPIRCCPYPSFAKSDKR
ncbi:uncharacterized protein LAJ45_10978 [Morchella importuna]|uniref:uncharacterized protein n=1 Tax=Morchella importuna TaxID=1174673 RepID=UPI001E8E6CD1|nr:uncharacterized protein LAJ45_10978 [Morchella importuna]KAH8144958.1 hypothetical protein LAJ45_10978 [Morchella importuna]